jgi:hypothetical protein
MKIAASSVGAMILMVLVPHFAAATAAGGQVWKVPYACGRFHHGPVWTSATELTCYQTG